jgi:serine/threonine-protein kinase
MKNMALKGQEKQNLELAISREFPGHSINSNAPCGQNSFSINYLLTDSNGSISLLKILLKNKIKATINQEQALAEIDIYKSVSSPYVLKPISCKQTQEYIFLQLPFLSGANLKEYRANNTPSEADIINIAISLLRGISDLSRKNIVHQDIKPENIFIESNGDVKILDFGSARFNKSPFRGATRHNFCYASPEQIICSRPNNIESLRLTIDDRSDVYAAGLVLYYLIEGHHPYSDITMPADAIFAGNKIPEITRTDIPLWLKNVVLRMLEHNQLNRPNSQSAVNFLEQKEVTLPKLSNGGFYYCAINGVSRFIKIKNAAPDLFDGLVIDASQVPIKNEERAQLLKGVKTILIDPQFYLFQSPDHCSKKFKKLPYYRQKNLFDDLSVFLTKTKQADQSIIDLINEAVDYQINFGSTAVIPPFFYIKEFNDDSWSVDQEVTHLSLGILEKYKDIKPTVKGVAIAQEILTSRTSRKRLLEYLTSLNDKVEGYMILLDSMHTEVINEEAWLKGAQDLFIKLLSTGRYVIWNKADFSSLALASTGISIATGEMLKQRRFNITEQKQQFGKTVSYYYIPTIFAKASWPEVLRSLASYDEINKFFCTDACCNGIDFNQPSGREAPDLAFHLIASMAKQYKRYNQSSGKQLFEADVLEAKRHFDNFKNHPNLIIREAFKKNIKPSTGSFLDCWLNTINS